MGRRKHVEAEPRRNRGLALSIVLPCAIATLIGLFFLWPSGGVTNPQQGAAGEFDGTVQAINSVTCPADAVDAVDAVNGCGTATVDVEGEGTVDVELPTGVGAPILDEGDDVVLIQGGSAENPGFLIVDHQRSIGLWILLIAFAAAVIAFGRWKGLSAIFGLAVTFVFLFQFIIPAILGGEAPLAVAIVGSSAIMLCVLYLTHGFNLSTTVAVVGTIACFVLTGLLSWVSVEGLNLTGVTDDLSMIVGTTYSVDPAGLLLAGIVIGSLGVLDDVTVTQAATVRELVRANPEFSRRELYRSASRVGRSHIASVINTIVLAYAGASLPVMILTVADSTSFGSVLTSQFITQEIVRSTAATLGLIAAVPITTAIAAAVLAPRRGAHAG